MCQARNYSRITVVKKKELFFLLKNNNNNTVNYRLENL